MDIKSLEKRLTEELQTNFNVKILDSACWNLPIYPIEITFQTVKKTTMDILMKMMLMTFKQATIETTEQLSELLLVEQIFIDDLTSKMLATKLIEKNGDYYSLTKSGDKQLKAGIYEHERVHQTKKLPYSPFHQAFMDGQIESVLYEGELFRYADELKDWDGTSLENSIMINALENSGVVSNDGNVQVIISQVESSLTLDLKLIPCLEFRLYNASKDIVYARVWNTLVSGWDEKLEEQLNDQERKVWQERYLLNKQS